MLVVLKTFPGAFLPAKVFRFQLDGILGCGFFLPFRVNFIIMDLTNLKCNLSIKYIVKKRNYVYKNTQKSSTFYLHFLNIIAFCIAKPNFL